MSCDLCGAKGSTRLTKIEGIAYSVCDACARYGEEVKVAKPKKQHSLRHDMRVVRNDFSTQLRTYRQSRGKSQEEFAKQLGVREADVHAWELNHRKPTIEQATAFEKILDMSILEVVEQDEYSTKFSSSTDEGLTIGDLIVKKKKKN